MLKQGRGCIINLASPTALRGYEASRLTAPAREGSLVSLVPCSRDHIRVNAIVPGTIDTPMNAAELSDEKMRQKLIATAPCGRLGTGDDVAGLAVFMASDDANYCVGGFCTVDGGMMAI